MKIIFTIFIGIIFLSCKQIKNRNVYNNDDLTVLIQRIDSLFNLYYNDSGPAAAIFLSYKGKEVIKKGYGLRNIEKGEMADSKTNFRSGSLAKQFTNLAILNLVQENRIKLSDTVFKYFPYQIFKDVTISQLISHTSGIEDAEWVVCKNWNSKDYVHLNDIMNWYKNNNVKRFESGSQFEYNNGAYYVLVQLVEKISGMSFANYMKKIVFEKIGMENTYYINDQNIDNIPNKAICYERDSLGKWISDEHRPYNILVGPGGLYTNLEDYSRYFDALRKCQILEDKFHQLIFKPISMDIELHSEDLRALKGVKSSYAMGWEVTDSLAVSAGLYYGVNNWSIFEFERPLNMVIFTNNTILFKEELVDKTYKIINEYVKTTANNGFK